jgi:hypothetical protein
MPLEPSKQLAEVCSCRRFGASRHRRRRQSGQGGRTHLAWAVAELSSEGAAETRGICEAQIIGNCGDRLLVDMRPFVQEFLPQRPQERHFRGYFDFCARRPGEMRSPGAIANDPMIDRIAPQVALRSDNVDGRCDGSAHRQAAQLSIYTSRQKIRRPSVVWVGRRGPGYTTPATPRTDPGRRNRVAKTSGVIVFCASSPKALRSAQPPPSRRARSATDFATRYADKLSPCQLYSARSFRSAVFGHRSASNSHHCP